MPKKPSSSEPLPKARNYCARQERCQHQVRDKLYAWEVPTCEIEPIISQLIGEGYLNEARFVEHFAISKFREKSWGRRKIEVALKQKQMSGLTLSVHPFLAAYFTKGLPSIQHKWWWRWKKWVKVVGEGSHQYLDYTVGLRRERDPIVVQSNLCRPILRRFDAVI
jgi:hypothetical protein